MTIETMRSSEVKELLEKIAGFDKAGGDERVKKIVHRLMHDIFQIIEDFDVTPEEFWSAAYYVGELGANGETGLLAPGLGMDRYLDIRQDAEDEQAGLAGGTSRTIEGPLYVAGAPISEGFARMDDGSDREAEVILIKGQVTDDKGAPIANAVVDIWHADTKGAYSFFDQSQTEYHLRRRIKTDAYGRYAAQSIMPSGYGCPPEGSTQKLLNLLGRHGRRPAHIHYFVAKPGFKHLTTQINISGDEYTFDDFAFATREELVVDAKPVEHSETAAKHGVTGPITEVEFNVVLVATDKAELHERHARRRALETTE
ncbi:catechol 1,2-dioxygenase [Pseudomonas reactans]|uniref:catechol 1,2-dioxygenase n=1 Tax=Pseudomonas reactans TaxID=117680 RepID=A0A7Y8G812_9PSED|nr:catechol 1,2-dioxygenase [Pseudomonas reactans]NWD84337.1 catechol 1,2-dioxygenase [Pseudomonas reactans]NWE92378.1 catechol 1,2-dioxygenase [Pseudomonas reactans]